MKIKIRRAKIMDLPSLVEKVYKYYTQLRDKGDRYIAQDNSVLRGGIIIEAGAGFSNPNWLYTVAVKDDEVIAFMIAFLEFCSPTSEFHKCVRIHADFQESDSLAGPKILMGLWSLVDSWAKENGAEFYYANIHPGNQPSVRAAKHVGFKHQYTQFYRPMEIVKREEEE